MYIDAWSELSGKNVLFKYNVKTGEFKMIGEKPLWTIQTVVGDKLVGFSEYTGRISVLDLKTDKFLVYDEELNLHE